jgi:hypothetical protein
MPEHVELGLVGVEDGGNVDQLNIVKKGFYNY